MSVKRTEAFEVNKDFELEVDICKAAERNGKRILTGVASGVLEDADGERVSRNAIVKMSRSAIQGVKLVAGSHSQDWHNEIGDVVKLAHDPETDELLIDCQLPPEGEDPIADKAWTAQTVRGEKLGFSIGGKLKSHFFELAEGGRRRKVLDDIALRHVALTKKPSYRESFSVAVAKIDDGEAPTDTGAYALDVEDDAPGKIVAEVDVAKADSTVASAPQSGGANAGTDDAKPDLDVDDDGDDDAKADDKKKLPQGTGERHLACPNCGHEFAAEMPADVDTPAEELGGDDNDRDAHKRAPESEETGMPLDKTLEQLRTLAGVTGDDKIEKQDDEPAAGELSDVEKLVAASHEAQAEGLTALDDRVAKGFEVVGDVLKKLIERFEDQPAGRKSVARAGTGTPTRAEVEAGTVEKTDDGSVNLEDEVAKIAAEGDPAKALALLNKGVYGVESNIAERPTQSGGLDAASWNQ